MIFFNLLGAKPQKSHGGCLEWEGPEAIVVGLIGVPQREQSICSPHTFPAPLPSHIPHPSPPRQAVLLVFVSRYTSSIGDKRQCSRQLVM